MIYLIKIYITLIEHRILINIVTSILFLLYNSYNDSFLLGINDMNYEGKNYLPYHEGIVETNQGLRVELEGDNNSNLVQTNQGYRVELENNDNSFIEPRTNHPSNYQSLPQNDEQSTQLGTIHSDDDYSTQIGIIEPRESELNNEGIHWGNNYPGPIANTPNTLSSIKRKFTDTYKKAENKYHKLEEKYEGKILKQIEKDKKWEEHLWNTRSINGRWVPGSMMRRLREDGYTISEGKVVKLKKNPFPY